MNVEPPGAVTLEKRQSITPPKYVFAQGSTTKSEPAKAKIQIKGRVANLNNNSGQRDGYDYYENYYNGTQNVSNYRPQTNSYATATQVLGEIDVTIYYSGFDCLTVSATDDLTYNLSNVAAPLTKKISITNNCAEPVRITGATSRTPDLYVGLIPAGVLQPNQGMEARLTVSALKDSLRLTGHPIEITAITELSQTPLQTRSLPIDVFVGEDFASQYSKVLKGVSVSVCGQDEKEKADTPKLASGTDCAEGYCDAEHAAEYIAKKLESIQKRAVAQGYSKQNLSENFGCAGKGYCTFSEVGVENDKFDLYLMSDRISTEAIKAALGDTSGTTTSGFTGGTLSTGAFLIEPFDVTSDTIASVAQSGYNRRIFVDNDLAGCGYYRITIDGAYSVFGGTIQFDRPVIVVRAQDFEDNPRIETKECATNIINLQNHAPIDKSFGIGDDYGSWLTNVESEPVLDEIAKKIAKSFLKSEDRHSSSGPGNTIKLEQAALEGARAEICIGGNQRKTITVRVNSEIATLSGTEKETYETFVAKMVSEALSGDIGGTNCFTKGADGYDCLRLTDLGGVAPLAMRIPTKTMSLDSTSGCVAAKVVSSASETVDFQISKGEKFIGISKIEVKDINSAGSKVYYEANYDGKRFIETKNESIKLQRGDVKDEPYVAEVMVCAYSDSDKSGTGEVAYIQAHDSSFTIIAINKTGGRKTTDEDGLIKINVGTLHPNDLIDRLNPPTTLLKGTSSPYYFTVMWAGNPDAISFDEYVEGMKRLRNLDNVIWDTEDSAKAGTTKFSSLEKTGKAKALGWYFGSCAVTSGVCNAGTGVIGASLNALADCGIPAVTVFRTDLVQALPALEGAYDFIGQLIPIAKINADPNYDPTYWKPMTVGAVAGGVKDIFSTSTPRLWGGTTTGNIGWAADQVESTYKLSAEATLNRTLTTPDPDLVREMSDAYAKTVRAEFEKQLRASYTSEFQKKGIINRRYANAHVDFTDAADSALSSANNSKTFGEFLTSNVDPKAATGQRWIDKIAPTQQTADELLTKFNRGSITSELAKANNFADGSLQNVLNERLSRLTSQSSGTLTQSDVKSAIGKHLTDNYPDMPQGIRNQIIDDSVGRISDITWDATATPPIPRPTSGDLDNIILKAAEDAKTSFTTNASDYATLTKGQIDDAGRALSREIAEEVGKKGDDFASQIAKPSKLRSLLNSGKFWRGLGWGIFCGAVSNAAGMYAYNRSIGTTAKDIEAESASVKDPNFVFIKGETYKMTISDSEVGDKVVPIFSTLEEKDKATMLEYLAEKDNSDKRLISKENKEGKTPAERKLQLYLLVSNPTIAEREMEKHSRFTQNIIDREINNLVKNDVQLLIQKYSAATIVQGSEKTENKDVLKHNGNPAPEPLVIAVVLQAMIRQDFGGDAAIRSELEGKSGSDYIKAKVEQALTEMDSGPLDAVAGEKVFPGKGDEFSQNVAMWRLIHASSSQK